MCIGHHQYLPLNCQEYKRVLYIIRLTLKETLAESSGSDMNRGKGYIVRGAGTGLTGGTSVIRNATFTEYQ
jgi:hypothetical protein